MFKEILVQSLALKYLFFNQKIGGIQRNKKSMAHTQEKQQSVETVLGSPDVVLTKQRRNSR